VAIKWGGGGGGGGVSAQASPDRATSYLPARGKKGGRVAVGIREARGKVGSNQEGACVNKTFFGDCRAGSGGTLQNDVGQG